MDAAEAFDAADFEYSGELDIERFVQALSDDNLVAQVSRATGLSKRFFDSLSIEGLMDLFAQIDTDCSGTVSFQEWVSFLVQIRSDIYQKEKEDEQAFVTDFVKVAESAFDEGDEDWSGEFDYREFVLALKRSQSFVEKVGLMTGLAPETFSELNE